MDSLIHFCRLCLQRFTGHFLLINKDPTASGMIKHLFPGMNMDLVEKSKICSECFKNIQFAYTMRETVIKNEQKIYANLELIRAIEENTCRFCLNTDNSQARVFLYDSTYDASMSVLEVRCVIEIAIIAVGFEIFKKPVICNSCWQIVRLIYLFKKRCFATEKILKFYCTKTNLASLPCKEIEYISTCFNSNLQKFSKGDKHDMGATLIPIDNIAYAQQQISTSVVNIIRPVDVYLNNFTIEDEDDTFEEDIDDVFIESPRIVKRELSNTPIEDEKIEVEEHNVILEEKVETLDGISEADIEIKAEAAKWLDISPKDINNQVDNEILPGDINDCLETGGCKRKAEESHIKNPTGFEIVSAEKMKIGIKEKNSESGFEVIVNTRVEIFEDRNNTSSVFEERECMKDGHKITEYFSLDNKKCQSNLNKINGNNTHTIGTQGKKVKKILKSNFMKTGKEKATKKRSVKTRKKKLKKEPTKLKSISEDNLDENLAPVTETQRNKSENLDNIIKLPTLHNNNFTKVGMEEETIKHIDKKRKISLKNLQASDEQTKNNSKNDQAETLGIVAKQQTTASGSITKTKPKNSIINTFNKDGLQADTIEHLKDSGETTNFKNSEYKHKETGEQLVKQQIKKSDLTRMVNKNCKENGGEGNYKSISKTPRNLKNRDIIWSCTQCKYKTKHKQHLTRHSLIHIKSPKILTCPKCIYSTHIQRNLDRHMMKHSAEYFFHCAHCTYSTISKSHLNLHMPIHERHKGMKELTKREVVLNKPFGFRCEDCPFMTSKEGQFVSHVRTHQSFEKIFKCEVCHYITTRPHSLQLHMQIHKEQIEKNFTCKYCSFTGRRHTDLVSHMVMHQKDFKFSCSECDYKAKRKSHLVTHILRHQRDKKNMFQCPYCEYKSIRKEHLQSHCRNRHFDKEDIDLNKAKVTAVDIDNGSAKDQKVPKCPYCLYKQKVGSTLEAHIFTAHFPSNSKKMVCNHCSYQTVERKRFMKHINYYHPTKDKGHFPSESEIMHCNDCLYKTKNRKLFLRHINQNHGADKKK